MSGYKDILKKGWHPEKPGTTIKGQMVSSREPVKLIQQSLTRRAERPRGPQEIR